MNRAPRPEFFMLFFLQKQKRHSKNILMNNVIFTLLYIKLNGKLQRIFGHREFLDTLNHHITSSHLHKMGYVALFHETCGSVYLLSASIISGLFDCCV